MLTQSLTLLFERDLDRLKKEIEAFDTEKLWMVDGDMTNSAGNLCLHLCGNLQHYIGAVLGGSGYVRERDREFNDTNVDKAILYDLIDKSKEVIKSTLPLLSREDLQKEYPLTILGNTMITDLFLLHLLGHLNYHLGQINYCRRLLVG